nr:hypothetical protein [Sphingomonas quercus]
MTDADRQKVSAAVAAAEAGTDGEIVTIVAPASDDYADVPLAWALIAVFLALATLAAFPDLLLWVHSILQRGWTHEPSLSEHLTVLFVLLALKFAGARLIAGLWPVRMMLTPGRIKSQRVRARALDLFRVGAEQRTRKATAVLLYLSLAEHRAELIGDAAISAKVTPDMWGEAMAALITAVKDGRPGDGMAEAVARIGEVLHVHFPRSADDTNELPDRVIEL